MAGAFITTDFTTVSDAESTTGWGGDTFTLENEIFVQGSNSVAVIQNANGVNDIYFDKASGSWNMSGSHVRCYMNSNIMSNTDTEANNGIQLFLYDGTNTAFYTIGGTDTYSGGWKDFFVDCDSTPTSGSVAITAVTRVGIRINTTTEPQNITNGWYDFFRFGNGITLKSATTEAFDFQDAADFDVAVAQAWGILQESDGVLFGKGKLTIGHATANTNLVSSGETIYFIDRTVSSTLYGFDLVVGAGTTDVSINDLVCKTVGTSAAEVNFTAAADSLSLTGSTFIDMGTIKFGKKQIVAGNTFSGCAEIDTNNATMSNCIITGTSEAVTGGLIINKGDEAASITNMNFKDYPANYAVYVAAGVTSFTMDNWIFDDPNNTASVALYWAASSGTLTISPTNGTNLVIAGTDSAGGAVTVTPLAGGGGGLTVVQNALLERTAYISALVYINVELAAAGNGTQEFPFNDFNTGKDYAETNGIKCIQIQGEATLTSNMKGFSVHGLGQGILHLNGQDINESTFDFMTIEGDYLGTIIVNQCQINTGTTLDGIFDRCLLDGTSICRDGSIVLVANSTSAGFGVFRPEISMNGIGTSFLAVRNHSGNLDISDCNNAFDELVIEFFQGDVLLNASNTAGRIVLRGNLKVTDNSNGSTIIDETTWQNNQNIDRLVNYNEGTWQIIADQMIYFNIDGTELMRFNLLDSGGQPTSRGAMQRIKV